MSASLDLLSACASLHDILSLVSHSDILNCKLVNRRVNLVIMNNAFTMPRQKAKLSIVTYTEYAANTCMIRLSVRTRLTGEFFITENQIHLLKAPDRLKLTETIVEKRDIQLGEMTRLKQMMYWFKYNSDTDFVTYATKNNEDCFKYILSILFRTYHFDIIDIEVSGLSESFYQAILNEFRVSRATCDILKVAGEVISAMVRRLVDNLECQTVALDKFRFLEGYTQLPSFSNSHKRTYFVDLFGSCNTTANVMIRGPFMELIQNWKNELHRIKGVSVGLAWGRGGYLFELEALLNWLGDDIFYRKNNEKADNCNFRHTHKEIYIRRKADDVVLCISYSDSRQNCIHMQDFVYSGDLEQLQNHDHDLTCKTLPIYNRR